MNTMESCLKTDTVAQYSYNDIHNTVHKMAPAVKAFRPDIIVAIGGGGFIPARMLRAHFEKVPIIAVSMEAYDDTTNTIRDSIKIHQWFDPLKGHGAKIHGGRVVIVDEIDDTRLTLSRCVEELKKAGPTEIAVAVVHNKRKVKARELPDDVLYIAGEQIEDVWIQYPWDFATPAV